DRRHRFNTRRLPCRPDGWAHRHFGARIRTPDIASRARSCGCQPDGTRAGADADLYPDGGGALPASFRPLSGQAMTARSQTPAVLLFAALALFPLAAHYGAQAYLLALGARALILALAALSLDFLVGQVALVSFGHAAYLGLGAYAVA